MAPDEEWDTIWHIWKQAEKYMQELSESAKDRPIAKHDILDA